MFAAIGRFDARFRWLIVALWIAIAVGVVRTLPSPSSVIQTGNVQFLPASSPSVQAARLAAPFQGPDPAGTAIIVAHREGGPLTDADLAAIDQVERAAARVPGVTQVRAAGRSKDGVAAEALVTAAPSVPGNNAAEKDVVDGVRATFSLSGAASGLDLQLTGPLAVSVDSASSGASRGRAITLFTILFVVVLLFAVYRAALAPLITLVPAALAVVVSGPLIAESSRAGLSVSAISQQLLIVLLLGAGSDYGLFLSFRVREEIAGGRAPAEALVTAVARVGEAITYSGLTVAAALLTLLLAPFGIYRGLGPALAIGVGVMLAAALTLTPALLAIFGRAAFWPLRPGAAPSSPGIWGRVAERVVRRPLLTLAAGVVLFGALAAGLAGYRTSGLSGGPPAGSEAAAGAAQLAAHFPRASAGADQLLLRFAAPVRDDPALLGSIRAGLAAAPAFRSVGDPLVGPDGRTVQSYAVLATGPVGSAAAAGGVPAARDALSAVARTAGAEAYGIAGQDASAYDIDSASNTSLELVVPAILVLILVLLALLLRSLVAPWYLALTVGLSYLASLGFAMIVFVHLGGADGLIFVLPLLMFVFSMALGEDYNILVMSRIREEAHHAPSLPVALTRAIEVTGGTVTSAGMILAGTFAVLGLVGGNSQAQQLGFSIAFGVVLDTFFVRTLLIPSIAMLLGRWNWWPSALSRRAG